MIIHILTILFVVLFWNTSVTINGFGKTFAFPFSLAILTYVVSLYLIIKSFLVFKNLKNTWFSNKSNIEKAKENCAEAMLSYIAGDVDHGSKLWQKASQYLSQDKLFVLLSAVNAKFYEDNNIRDCIKEVPGCGLISEYYKEFIKPIDKIDMIRSSNSSLSQYSKTELLNIVKEYKSSWAYKELVEIYLNNAQIKLAEDMLKQFAKSDNVSTNEWRILRAKIFMKEAEQERKIDKKYKLWRKANRLDPTFAVFDLAKYYKQNEDLYKARKIIEAAWQVAPSIRLGKFYTELDDFDTIPIHKFQHARMLSGLNEDHAISHILVATYAMESELWAIALEHLNKFKEKYPALACMLLARLEANKSGNSVKVWKNIERAFVLVAQDANLDVDSIV